MKMRRLISAIIALLLVVNLSVTAFAAEWYLEDGDITVSAGDSGQTVSQGSSTDVADDAPVIKQRDSSKTTDSTITISTSDNATANVTIQDINISSTGDAIDVGSSSANITLEGDNKIFSESGSALHVSAGDVTITGSGSLEAEIGDSTENENDNAIIGSHKGEDMSGKIHITGSATVTTEDDEEDDFRGDGAGIGSGEDGNMSGSITIDGNAKVNAFSQEDGAGIGSGKYGNMSGSITISDNAQVTAGSGWDGAGIGAGESAYDPQKGEMSGTITIGGNAKVTAWSEEGGTGIGSGEDGDVSGTVIIGGNARVTAGSDDESAGIGSGNDGSITSTGRIIIRDSAKVTAIGEDEGAGIGAGDGEHMAGLIIIQDNAQVTAIAGDSAAAIGSDDKDDMRGTILILGNARITTGMPLNDKVAFNYETKKIEYTLDENAIGRIGDGQGSNHKSLEGHYVLGPDVTINGRNGSDIEALKDYINMRLSGENHDGDPENLTAGHPQRKRQVHRDSVRRGYCRKNSLWQQRDRSCRAGYLPRHLCPAAGRRDDRIPDRHACGAGREIRRRGYPAKSPLPRDRQGRQGHCLHGRAEGRRADRHRGHRLCRADGKAQRHRHHQGAGRGKNRLCHQGCDLRVPAR